MSAAKAQAMRGLGVALGAVVEQGAGRRGGRRGVGEVVGQHLVGVGAAGLVEVADGRADHARRRGRRPRPRPTGQRWSVTVTARGYRRGTAASGIAAGAYPGPMAGGTALERGDRGALRAAGRRGRLAGARRPAARRDRRRALRRAPGEPVRARAGAGRRGDAAGLVEHRQVDGPRRASAMLVGDGLVRPLDPAPVPEWRGTEQEAITVLDLLEMRSGPGVRRGLRRRRVVRRHRHAVRRRRRRTTPRTPRRSRCCTRRARCGATRRARRTSSPGSSATSSPATRTPTPAAARGGDARVPRPAPVRPARDDRRRPPLRRGRQLGRRRRTCTPRPASSPASASCTCATASSATSASCRRARSTTPARSSPATPRPGFDYGRHWWVWPDQPGSLAAHGYEGQYVIVLPEHDAVVVHLGKTDATVRDRLVARLRRADRGAVSDASPRRIAPDRGRSCASKVAVVTGGVARGRREPRHGDGRAAADPARPVEAAQAAAVPPDAADDQGRPVRRRHLHLRPAADPGLPGRRPRAHPRRAAVPRRSASRCSSRRGSPTRC